MRLLYHRFFKKTTLYTWFVSYSVEIRIYNIRFIPFLGEIRTRTASSGCFRQAAQTAALAQQINQRCGNFRAVAQILDGNERRLLARIHDALRGGLAQPGRALKGMRIVFSSTT